MINLAFAGLFTKNEKPCSKSFTYHPYLVGCLCVVGLAETFDILRLEEISTIVAQHGPLAADSDLRVDFVASTWLAHHAQYIRYLSTNIPHTKLTATPETLQPSTMVVSQNIYPGLWLEQGGDGIPASGSLALKCLTNETA